jgi:hypothetical protein
MSEQRLYNDLPDALLRPRVGGDDPSASASRLTNARGELNQLYVAADAILDGIRQGNSTKFLEQVRQSGGE